MTGDRVLHGLWHRRPETDPLTWSIQRLAYIGDAVFELYVRMFLITASNKPSGALHGQSVRLVSAAAQAAALESISASLSSTETDLVRRGRNAKPHSMPKHASQSVYRLATAFEALIGYLYLTEQDERAAEICHTILEASEHEEADPKPET
ncbi:MAG TPA: ribonuclease III [Clostridiaceae bacterium]|jgi:ribonuclease-3 family protein|nr:ribonuclease III [Clostridiaceae bacterium]